MNPVPPKINAPAFRLPFAILAVAFLALGGILYFFNPSTHHFYPECQFHRLTGLNCPGCGMTRAVYALLHGEFATAMRDNALLVGVLVWLFARAAWFKLNERRGRQNGEFFQTKQLGIMLVIAMAFTVLRNLPAFAFLSP